VNEQIGGADYVRALQVREILQRKMMELFDTYDVLVSASQPIPATTLETNLETDVVFADPLGAIRKSLWTARSLCPVRLHRQESSGWAALHGPRGK